MSTQDGELRPGHRLCAQFIVFTFICGALLASSSSCARSRTPEPRLVVGQTTEVEGWRITVHSFVRLAATEDRLPSPDYLFCSVEVTLENHSDAIRFFMPERQMTLTDANGSVYELDHNASVAAAQSRQWTVPDGEISIGETAHGAASYQIPADARELSWVFSSSLFPGTRQLTFELGDAPQ
jgi:hypothetical protein